MAALASQPATMSAALGSLSGKRVFVTGHTGFKGSWLSFILSELGAEVMGYALAPDTSPNHFALLKLERRVRHVIGDTRDLARLDEHLRSFEPEYVFHLAAQPLVRQSYDDPIGTLQTNVLGSAHLLEAVRHCESVRSLVYVTSDKCYENVDWVWGYRESDRLGGHDPYSASKAAAELVFSAFTRSFFSSRKRLGAATRPWQHVLEPLSGYLLLAASLYEHPNAYGGAWNFGPTTQEVRTVHDVATAIIQQLGRGTIAPASSMDGQHEASYLQLNCDKAHQLLGWYPRWSVGKALEATAQWYAAVFGGAEAERITRAQIKDYSREL